MAMIVEISIPNDSGLKRGERKVTKYQGLIQDMKKKLKLKNISIVPLIVGATGLH